MKNSFNTRRDIGFGNLYDGMSRGETSMDSTSSIAKPHLKMNRRVRQGFDFDWHYYKLELTAF